MRSPGVNALQAARQRVFERLWFIEPASALLLRGTSASALHQLALAARPSTERLHLRDFFAQGRRYDLQTRAGGFAMSCTNRIPWMRRRRTRAAAVLVGTFSEFGGGMIGLRLRARLALPFFLDIFPVPLVFSILLIAGPLPKALALGGCLLLFGLSWLWHRYTAIVQAIDMTRFIQAALAEIAAGEPPQLSASTPDILAPDEAD